MLALFGGAWALADFTVWDNNGAYALVTFVSLAFTVILIVTVSRQSRAHDQARRGAAPRPASLAKTAAPPELPEAETSA